MVLPYTYPSLSDKISGDNVSIADLADFICASQIARELDEFHTDPEEQKVWLKPPL